MSLRDWLNSQDWPDPTPVSEQFEFIQAVGGVDAVRHKQGGTVYITRVTAVYFFDNGIGFNKGVIDEELFDQILSTFKFID